MDPRIDPQISREEFRAFDPETRRRIYQEANELNAVELVRRLNDFGMKPEVARPRGLVRISSYMDLASKHDEILGLFRDWRQGKRLFTATELQSFNPEDWVAKSGLGRVLGRDYLAKIIASQGFKYVKVPQKIVVVDDGSSLSVSGWARANELYDLSSQQTKVYAEKVIGVERKLKRAEIDELIELVRIANFVDLWPDNIIVAQDGLYFIDSERCCCITPAR